MNESSSHCGCSSRSCGQTPLPRICHAAGAAPYETASTLAPWPSPEVGMAERHAVGPSHSSLPPKPSARGQTFRSFGQECPWNRSPGTLWFTGMPLPRAGGPRSTPWCRHHHFGESTVYETCLCLEVEPVRRMVLFSQRRPPEMPDQICAVLLAARVGAKTVSLHPQGSM